jgi:tRNA 2-thiouridine synthesizing protein E
MSDILANISLNAEGFMTDPNQWTREIAEELARQEGIETLTPEHWKIIEY